MRFAHGPASVSQNHHRLTPSGPIASMRAPRGAAACVDRSIAMNRPLIVIFTAIVLDAVGIGLIFPILPRAARGGDPRRERRALYRHHDRALRGHAVRLRAGARRAQRPARPPPGAADLARRRGRSTTCSWPSRRTSGCCCSAAPSPGLTSANVSVATAYITDISPEDTARPPLRPAQRHVRHRLHHRAGARRRARRLLGAAALHRRGGAQRRQPAAGVLRAAGIAHAERARNSTSPRSIRCGRCAGCSR